MSVPYVPAGYRTITPYLVAADCAAAIDFYVRAFGAEECVRMPGPDGKVMHAEIRIGDSMLMLSDEAPDWGAHGPAHFGGSPGHVMLYLPDADATFAQALAAGATVVRPMENQFWGDRMGRIKDPFGHEWSLATHIEEVAPEEMERRMAAMFAG